jgi:superfamily II DNA/RNA helicase
MSIKGTQALILAPTRELAQQIQKVVIVLGDYMSIECHACVGGTNVREDMAKLQEGVHVVVSTPASGRHTRLTRSFPLLSIINPRKNLSVSFPKMAITARPSEKRS